MDHLEDENYPIKRPTFLTVLCILTFVGSGWALFTSAISYNSAEVTVAIYNDSLINRKTVINAETDSLKIENESEPGDTVEIIHKSPDSLMDSTKSESDIYADSVSNEIHPDTTAENFDMGKVFGEKMKKNIMDMISVEKMKQSAMGGFIAALFTLAGAISMWLLRKFGLYLYIIGIVIGIAIPFYIYGNNLLAIGLSGFGSFFGLVFIALYALNLKSMK